MGKRAIPDRLYKYRAFGNRTLEMLVEDSIYFADPSAFNDPLDAKPTLETDLAAAQLEQILSQLVEQRVRAEMTAAAKTISYRGPKTVEHIARHSRRRAEQRIADIRYSATHPDFDVAEPEKLLFSQSVEDELLRRYNKGVFSLAQRSECPLMWSHYGDQHKGICLGYSVPTDASYQLDKVRYGGSRLIKASLVAAMLGGDRSAQREVDDAVLLRKAYAWQYEKEWRLIGGRGAQDSRLDLKEVVFGMRCSAPVIYAVVKALEDRVRKVRFYEIRVPQGRFILQKRALNVDELKASHPRCNRAVLDSFSELNDP